MEPLDDQHPLMAEQSRPQQRYNKSNMWHRLYELAPIALAVVFGLVIAAAVLAARS